MEQSIFKKIFINSSVTKVWKALTLPALMQRWMADTPIEINTSWQQGSNITITGDWYKAGFKNSGIVLKAEKPVLLIYTHLSSLSRLADKEENYTILEFRLAAAEDGTGLSLTIRNFPTEAIYHHFNFFWMVALHRLKKLAEEY
ncbi:MAG TPA: SRPBCC domain-containing protein [Chitinophagaceae bacterium]|jgi:uncharacterized protein YndB with AHSA1/START domain|nr:SRPBCC domain-containing protein [Chitinophagaceae bacterium]